HEDGHGRIDNRPPSPPDDLDVLLEANFLFLGDLCRFQHHRPPDPSACRSAHRAALSITWLPPRVARTLRRTLAYIQRCERLEAMMVTTRHPAISRDGRDAPVRL